LIEPRGRLAVVLAVAEMEIGEMSQAHATE
jgi:hypothetical protein